MCLCIKTLLTHLYILSRNPSQSKYLRHYKLTTTETLDLIETEEIVENEREIVLHDIVKDNKHIEGTMI